MVRFLQARPRPSKRSVVLRFAEVASLIIVQALYASELLMVLNLALSKASVPVFLHHLSPKSGHRRAALIIGLVIALWSVISFIAAAAQCNAPRAWQVAGQNCFRQVSVNIRYSYKLKAHGSSMPFGPSTTSSMSSAN